MISKPDPGCALAAGRTKIPMGVVIALKVGELSKPAFLLREGYPSPTLHSKTDFARILDLGVV